MKPEWVAMVTLKVEAHMNAAHRRRTANWLRRQATFLIEHGTEFGDVFRARLMRR